MNYVFIVEHSAYRMDPTGVSISYFWKPHAAVLCTTFVIV